MDPGRGDPTSPATDGWPAAATPATSSLEAMIALIDAGNPSPTGRLVAERAGVAVRTVYNHFPRLDDVFIAAADRQVSRYGSLITIIPPVGPAEPRIRVITGQRRRLFEAVGPVLRASSARVPTSPELIEVLDRQRHLLRFQLARTLGPEIRRHETPVRMVLGTLEALAGWQSWSSLRFGAGHSAAQAERIMHFGHRPTVCADVSSRRTRASD